jgi:hypothetical protein
MYNNSDRSVIFFRVIRFPPPINWPQRYNWNIVESGAKHHKQNHKPITLFTLFIYLLATETHYLLEGIP